MIELILLGAAASAACFLKKAHHERNAKQLEREILELDRQAQAIQARMRDRGER